MSNPIDFFNIPSHLIATMPADFLPVAAAVLNPLNDGSLDAFDPSVEALVMVLEDTFAVSLGMGYTSAAAMAADTIAHLYFASGLIDVERDEDCASGECSGKHGVSLTDKGREFLKVFKGREFLKVFKAALNSNGNGHAPRNRYHDRLQKDGEDFLKGWDETNN